VTAVVSTDGSVEELSPATFEKVWTEFTGQLKSDGPRVISMFKSIRTEVDSDKTIRIRLTNAAQKDLFNQNYRQKLLGFLSTRLDMGGADIETVVDLSETNDILYSDEQKYNYLSNKYPELRNFRKAFNLDIT
jgi:DNA polymerase-3 subunit gamma/tau